MLPHRIRLRGPWRIEPTAGRSRVEDLRDGGPALAGPAVCRRGFGWTAAPADHARVWLVAEDLHPAASVSLNGTALGAGNEWLLGATLPERNELEVRCEAGTGWREFRIEVRGRVFLADVVARSGGVSGRIVGEVDAPLDLYIVAVGSPTEHRTVRPGDSSFEIAMDLSAPSVRVELMRGAVVWHAEAVPVKGT